MRKIFLVDTENVNFTAIASADKLDKDDLVILFVTDRTVKNQFSDRSLELLNTKANILKIHVLTGGKNSLDFQLVSYLGLFIGEHKNEANKYYIVSRDKGFLSSINLLYNCTSHELHLIHSILCALSDDKVEDTTEVLIHKFCKQGFKEKTAIKMALIVTSQASYQKAMEKFLDVFKNPCVIGECEGIIKDYFNEENIA